MTDRVNDRLSQGPVKQGHHEVGEIFDVDADARQIRVGGEHATGSSTLANHGRAYDRPIEAGPGDDP